MPKALSDLLKYRNYDSLHTLDLLNQNSTSDKDLTEIAVLQERIVITKDSDFLESFLLSSKPKKLIIIRTGNISNKELLSLIDQNLNVIIELISRSNYIEITRTEIVEHES